MEPLDEPSSLILKANPDQWSQSEVEHLCQRFMRDCDSESGIVNRLLARQLWRYWLLVQKDQPLMGDPKYDLALMFHAAACGEFVPRPGDGEFLTRYRREHAESEESPAPAPLHWGPRATLNAAAGAALDSAVMHAYICRSEGQIHEILIAGQGLPEFRQEVLQTALSCMLRVQATDLDMLNVDAYRIVAPASNQTLLALPGVTTLGDASMLTPRDDLTAANALSDIAQKLRRLQEQTELVVVHECDARQKQGFEADLRECAKEVHQRQGVIVVAREAKKSPALADVMAFAPYYQIARRPSPLRITLDQAIIQLPSFEQLLEAFTYRTVERIYADARVRQKTYEERAAQLREEQERWRRSSDRTRKEMWDETQLLSEVFNVETGTIIRLAEPENVPTSVYMEKNLPWLIEHFDGWAMQMEKIVSDIVEATARPDTPIRRLAASRFLDAALRDRGHLIEDAATRRCFDRWSAQVAPLLRFKWKVTLRAKGIDAGAIFTRNTVFHTRFQVDETHDLVGLVMQPLVMVPPTKSVLVFDSSQPAMAVRNAYDHAKALDAATPPSADKLWESLKAALAKPYVNPDEFSAQLRRALSAAPFELLPKLIKEIAPAANEPPDNPSDSSQFEPQRAALIESLRVVRLPERITMLLKHGAIHSARELIKQTSVPEHLKVRLLLWRVLVECFAHHQDPSEAVPSLASGKFYAFWDAPQAGAQEIKRLLHEGKLLNRGFVEEWAERFSRPNGLLQAINFLKQDWVRLGDYISTSQQQTLYDSLQALESVVLAKAMIASLNLINPNSESTATLLTKVGQSLEDLLLTDLGATPFSDVISLLDILAGRETPSH